MLFYNHVELFKEAMWKIALELECASLMMGIWRGNLLLGDNIYDFVRRNDGHRDDDENRESSFLFKAKKLIEARVELYFHCTC